MATATIRFYAELNDYLPAQARGHDLTADFVAPCPVRHLIETLGVPHTEVEIILRNGVSVDLEAAADDGDRISVYPVFEALDVSPLLRLRTSALREPRFFADAQLGRLARYLRLCGFDTLYENNIDDADLARRAAAQRRIVLSRDRQLLMRREITHGCHIRQDRPVEQLAHVIQRCDLANRSRPFTRCMECNGLLDSVDKEDIGPDLKPQTRAYYDEFWRCRGCGRIYWRGSHYRRLQQLLASTLRDDD